jgi:biopolymer transport protein ExbB
LPGFEVERRERVFEIVKAGGWMMLPIVCCSIVAMAIVIERLWTLQAKRVTPPNLVAQVLQWVRVGQIDQKKLQALRSGSPLGRLLATGIINLHQERSTMKECIEDVGRHVVHELERYLNALGTIAAVSPLLGLLGTVTGMIKAFNAISVGGVGDPSVVAGGIAEALVATAAGLIVAIPAMLLYRFLRGRVGDLVVSMEQEALKLIEILLSDRRRGLQGQ